MSKIKFNRENIKQHFFQLLSTAYVLSIFYAMAAFNNDLMDPTLLPRMLVSLFINIIFFALIFMTGEGKKLLEVWMKWPYILFTLFWFWNCIAMFWAPVYAEAALEVARVGIFLLLFVLSGFFAGRDKHFMQKVILVSYIYGFFILYISSHEIRNLPETGHWYRYFVHALSGHKNLLSSILYLLLGFAVAGFLVLPWYISWVGIVLIGGYGYLIYFLETRAVLMAVMFSIFVFFTGLCNRMIKKNARLYLPILIIILVGISSIGVYLIKRNAESIKQKLESANMLVNWSKEERLVLWGKTLDVWKEKPFIGYGPGQWQFEFLKATNNGLEAATEQNFTFQRPHNDFLWMLFELGIVGTFIYLFFLASIFLHPTMGNRIRSETQNIYLIHLVFFVGFLIISFFDFPKERMEHYLLVSCMVGFFSETQRPIVLKILPIKVGQGILVLCFVIISFIAFNVTAARWKGEYFVKKMKKAYELQDYQQVSILAGKAKSALYVCDPTSIPLAWYESLAGFYLKSPDLGLNAALEAYKISPNNVHVVNQLAVVFEGVGNHEKAKEFFCKALDLYTPYDAARFNLAVIYYYEGNYVMAYRFANETTKDNTKKNEFLKIIEEKLTK